MLRKLLSFENNFTVAKATSIVAFFAMLSKLVAFFRDPLFAAALGGKKIYIWDIYNAAFRIPDFIFNLFILGTLSVAFIPIFVELLMSDKNRAQRVSNTILVGASFGMVAIFSFLFIFASPITRLIVPKFDAEKLQLAVQLTRLVIVSQVIFTVSNICTNILYAHRRFIMAGVAPILYNVGIIAGILFLYPRFGIRGLGYGVIIGAILHLAIQLPELFRSGFSFFYGVDFRDPSLFRMLKLYLPRIFVLDLSLFSLLVSTTIGSGLAAGSIAIYTTTINLQSIPISIIALSIATVIFPVLSESFAKKDETQFTELLKKSIIQITFFIVPLSVLLLILRAQIVRLYYGHGNFNWDNTIVTFSTLGVLAFSLLSQGLAPIFSRAFYARQNTFIPVVVNIGAMVINGMLAYILSFKYGIIGVAMGFSAASIVSVVTLFIILRFQLVKSNSFEFVEINLDKPLLAAGSKILLASVSLGLVSYTALYAVAPFLNTHTVIGIGLQSAISVIFGIGAFYYSASVLGIPEATIILDLLKKIRYSVVSTKPRTTDI